MVSSDQFAGQPLGRRPLLLVFLGLLLVPPISNLSIAQTTTSGGLAGVVTDPSNAVVPNADVEISDSAKGTRQSTRTDREGVYRLFFLAPERYTLTVTHGGFREEKQGVSEGCGENWTQAIEARPRAITRVWATVLASGWRQQPFGIPEITWVDESRSRDTDTDGQIGHELRSPFRQVDWLDSWLLLGSG
jgi:hypothetical protein